MSLPARPGSTAKNTLIGRADPAEPGHYDLRFSTQAEGLV
jgi:hypothetical protein